MQKKKKKVSKVMIIIIPIMGMRKVIINNFKEPLNVPL